MYSISHNVYYVKITVYAANAHAYQQRLDALQRQLVARMDAVPRDRRTVICAHDAFAYLGQAYGPSFLSPRGLSTQSEPSARDVAALITLAREQHVDALFLENISDPRLLDRIAAETGARIGGTLYSDSPVISRTPNVPLPSPVRARPARRSLHAALACLLLSAATGIEARPQPSQFQIVESVPEASLYDEPGVPRTQQTWLAMINGAKRRIDIAAFYLSEKPGTGLTPVLDALAARARAGVTVHLLVDHSFLAKNPDSVAWLGKAPGITHGARAAGRYADRRRAARQVHGHRRRQRVRRQPELDWRALEQIHEIGAPHRRCTLRQNLRRQLRFQLAPGRRRQAGQGAGARRAAAGLRPGHRRRSGAAGCR